MASSKKQFRRKRGDTKRGSIEKNIENAFQATMLIIEKIELELNNLQE